jgi:hypothetical protein
MVLLSSWCIALHPQDKVHYMPGGNALHPQNEAHVNSVRQNSDSSACWDPFFLSQIGLGKRLLYASIAEWQTLAARAEVD